MTDDGAADDGTTGDGATGESSTVSADGATTAAATIDGATADTPGAEVKSTTSQRLEVVAAVLLGLATVAIAWGAFQANLWSGLQDKALTDSARLTTEAASIYEEAGSLVSLDQIIFVEIILQLDQADPDDEAALDTVDFLLANMTVEGQEAVEAWFENDLDLPFTDEYYDALYADGDATVELSDEKFDEGSENNTNGDKYVLVSTILASVLFFAGISTVLQSNRTRFVLLLSGSVLWVGSAIFMLTLPMTSL